MKEIYFFDDELNVIWSMDRVTSVIPSIDRLEYICESEGFGKLDSINSLYIIVDEGTDVSSITKNDLYFYLKELKINQLKEVNEKEILQGFTHNNDLFSFDYKDQSNFNQQLTMMLMDSTISSIAWKTENGGIKMFTKDEFIAICRAGENHKRESINRFWTLKDVILSTNYNSIEEIKAITL